MLKMYLIFKWNIYLFNHIEQWLLCLVLCVCLCIVCTGKRYFRLTLLNKMVTTDIFQKGILPDHGENPLKLTVLMRNTFLKIFFPGELMKRT